MNKNNFNDLLGQIFDLIKLTNTEKERMIQKYNELVINEMTNLILSYEDEEKHLFNDQSFLADQLTTDPEAIEQSMRDLFDKINKDLSPQAKTQIYLFSKLTIFLQIIEPIIKNSNQEDAAAIGNILAANKQFLEGYVALKQIDQHLTIPQTA